MQAAQCTFQLDTTHCLTSVSQGNQLSALDFEAFLILILWHLL